MDIYHEKKEKKQNLQEKTIILVEDDLTIQNLISQYLQILGYNLVIANNGKEALNLIQKLKLNLSLLISDLIMPEMGGKDLAIALKKMYPELKIILISGYTQDEHTLEHLPEDSTIFLRKPFSTEILEQAIRELLEI